LETLSCMNLLLRQNEIACMLSMLIAGRAVAAAEEKLSTMDKE